MAKNLAADPESLETALILSGEPSKKAAVTLALKELISRRWFEEYRLNIKAFNDDITARGLWSENMRGW